jgi:hypothetical protein
MAAHIARLRHLRSLASDHKLRRDLGIMLGQTLILAGQRWIGLTDFGMAMEAYRSAAVLGEELHEDCLRTTGLLSQAQVGGIHAPAPWSASKRVSFLSETEALASAEPSPDVRVWLHATRAQVHTMIGQEREAFRALELAERAQAQVPLPQDFYFASVDSSYPLIQHASAVLTFGRPIEAVRLFQEAANRVDRGALATRAWFTVHLAAALAQADDVEQAVPTLVEALDLTRSSDTHLLALRVGRVADQLISRGGHPAIAELHERITHEQAR